MTSAPSQATEPPLKQVIVPRLGALSPALRRAADYVLSNPETIAMESLRQIAKNNQLTPATFSRLARSLDLESYEEMRELCRDEVRQRSRSFADKAAELQRVPAKGKGAFLKDHATTSIENIASLVETVDGEHLAAIAERLSDARSVLLIGALSSAALVDYIGYSAKMALPNWHTVMRNHGSASMDMADLGGNDVVLVVAQQPYARVAIDMARSAKERGVDVVAITDSYDAPVTMFADEVLITPTRSSHFFSSEVATVLLLETLLSMVVRRAGEKAQRRVAAIEKECHRSGEYWQG